MKKEVNCIFCDFISGNRKDNINGLPFRPLKETKHSISFLAINIPKKTKINVLVIPKEHFRFVEDVPKNIITDLMNHSQIIIKSLRKKFPGVNILLNDGKVAHQAVPHVHFHIYPRKKGDGFYKGLEKGFISNGNIKEFEKTYKEVSKLLKK